MSETAYIEFTVAGQITNGDDPFSSPANALTNTGTAASCDVADKGGVTHTLTLTDVDGALSEITGADIDGIEIEIHGSAESTDVADLVVKLIIGGSVVGNNKAVTAWGSSPSSVVYGGPTDKWGLSPVDTDLTATDFGIAFQVVNDRSSPRFMYVYRIRVKVYYTPAVSGSDTTKGMFALAA